VGRNRLQSENSQIFHKKVILKVHLARIFLFNWVYCKFIMYQIYLIGILCKFCIVIGIFEYCEIMIND